MRETDASLLDLVDNLLNKGVVITGDLTLGLANVDLVYVQLSALLAAADRVLPGARASRAKARRAAGDLPAWLTAPRILARAAKPPLGERRERSARPR
jgi:gas vesicle structural protein